MNTLDLRLCSPCQTALARLVTFIVIYWIWILEVRNGFIVQVTEHLCDLKRSFEFEEAFLLNCVTPLLTLAFLILPPKGSMNVFIAISAKKSKDRNPPYQKVPLGMNAIALNNNILSNNLHIHRVGHPVCIASKYPVKYWGQYNSNEVRLCVF